MVAFGTGKIALVVAPAKDEALDSVQPIQLAEKMTAESKFQDK